MKKSLPILLLVLVTVACQVSSAATIVWFGAGVTAATGESVPFANWTIWMYESASSTTLPSQINPDGTTSQGDTLKTASATHQDTASSFYDNTLDNVALGITPTEYAFTVVFNTSTYGDMATATKYVILDNTPFDVPDPGVSPSFNYNAGGNAAGEWKALVPEPTTMALLGIGALTLAARRRR